MGFGPIPLGPRLWPRLSFVDPTRRFDLDFCRQQGREQVGDVDVEELGQAWGEVARGAANVKGKEFVHIARGAGTGCSSCKPRPRRASPSLLQPPAKAPTPGNGCGCPKGHHSPGPPWATLFVRRPCPARPPCLAAVHLSLPCTPLPRVAHPPIPRVAEGMSAFPKRP